MNYKYMKPKLILLIGLMFVTSNLFAERVETEKITISNDFVVISNTTLNTVKLNGNLNGNGNSATNFINVVCTNSPDYTNLLTLSSRIVVLEGGTVEKFAGNTLTVAGKIYQWSTNIWNAAVCTNESMCNRYLGVAVGTNSTTFGMLTLGKMTVTNTNLQPGNGIYVSATAQEWTQTVPTNSGYTIRFIGYATKTNEIYVNPDGVWAVIQ